MKTCAKCSLPKPDSDFYLIKGFTLSSYCKQCHRDHQKQWAATNRKKKLQINKRWRVNHSDRRKVANDASNRLWGAIRSGAVVRATTCSKCSSSSDVEAAHTDYTKPLEVVWLCAKCHRLWDSELPKTKVS